MPASHRPYTHRGKDQEEEVVVRGTKTCIQGPSMCTCRPTLPGCSNPIPADQSGIDSESRKL